VLETFRAADSGDLPFHCRPRSNHFDG
jgi:hypothetical protein